jgi:hypothetical protein
MDRVCAHAPVLLRGCSGTVLLHSSIDRIHRLFNCGTRNTTLAELILLVQSIVHG